MKIDGPLVSIIIPVYNGSDYLEKALISCFEQTYLNIEIIVVNDGSCDEGKTECIALKYTDRISYYKKNNGGVSSALNLGISKMHGKYFSWLSHDDEYYPEKIEKQVRLLEKYPGQKLLALCEDEFIDVDSNIIENKQSAKRIPGVYSSREATRLMLRNSLDGIALLIPREAFNECGFFDESLRFIQDGDMWQRMALSGYGIVVDDTKLVRMRLHANQQTNKHRERFIEESLRTLPSYDNELNKKGYYEEEMQLLYYASKWNLTKPCKLIKLNLRNKGQLKFRTSVKAAFIGLYGKIRPAVRKIYYILLFSRKK